MWRANSLEKTLMLGKTEGKRRSGRQRTRRLNDIIDSMDMSLSKLQEIVKKRETWGAAVHSVAVSNMTEWLNNNSSSSNLVPVPNSNNHSYLYSRSLSYLVHSNFGKQNQMKIHIPLLRFNRRKWRRQWQPTPVLLPGKSHGWRRLVGCNPWGR